MGWSFLGFGMFVWFCLTWKSRKTKEKTSKNGAEKQQKIAKPFFFDVFVVFGQQKKFLNFFCFAGWSFLGFRRGACICLKRKRWKTKEKRKKNGFNTTLFPGGPPPQYWAGSNRVNFGVRMRTGALRLIWSNPNKSNCKQILDQLGHQEIKKKSKVAKIAHTGTRTRNLLLRRQAPYPLGHTGISDFSLCHQKKSPRSRSRTSDLEISIASSYSLPLYQLSYTRILAHGSSLGRVVKAHA